MRCDVPPFQCQRLLERGEHVLCDRLGVSAVGPFEQDPILIAAEPGNCVLWAHRSEQSLRHGHEEVITGLMPHGVVDCLEVVDVQEEDAVDTFLSMLRRRPGVFQPMPQQLAVGKAGECVVQCLEVQLPLMLVALGDIADVEHHPGHRRVVEPVGQLRPDVMPAAVAVLEPAFDVERRSVAR
jgi:hypothetical protein